MAIEFSDAWIGVIGVALGGLFGLGGTMLGTHLNLRAAKSTALQLAEVERVKYARDRLSDERRSVYTRMIGLVASMQRQAVRIDDNFDDPEWGHPEAYFASDSFRSDSSKLWETWRDCTNLFDDSRLILSDAVASAFEDLRGTVMGSENDIPPGQYADTREALDTMHPILLSIAQREIAPELPA